MQNTHFIVGTLVVEDLLCEMSQELEENADALNRLVACLHPMLDRAAEAWWSLLPITQKLRMMA
ncbi:hypothetical protein HBDW_10590 [Herbaspirillum sp. DW155]|uniref:hypothetical protein n=1 Tax=Herbaspirillum sp. DW155 TaxID=3095609 RepID=UPI003090CF61|nr:hypothetical protein HBDW_10590 [Herbaspirillum sp. DW155]